MTKKPKSNWPLSRIIQVFLLAFGALVLLVPMVISATATEAVYSSGQALGILISGFCLLEAGAVLATVRRYRAGKDISLSLGACIGILIVGLLQIL